ncbi:uncharacterized protein LOC131043410 isoform X1 [Cryptomeria japonica]|uniref:uncharacterized protein LOC131043410 isoform X1 n=1 Tax=Cryptomeria japonica TaxID=3369 RepID=UPI0025AC5761|nr:uncharacterized protein LOC131043410 isoform X1 [Cryptomeria japonica]
MGFLPSQSSGLCGRTHDTRLLPNAVYTNCVYAPLKPATVPKSVMLKHSSNWRALKKTNGALSGRKISQGVRAMATVNGSPGRYKANSKEVIMVDPVEAKRLAVVQMQQLQAEAKLKRDCKIEAINGGWAMLGLTAGLVIEGYSGNGILSQLAGYFNALAGLLDKYIPS